MAEGEIGDPNNSGQVTSDSDDWRTFLPEDVREWQEVGTSETVEDFFRTMGDMRSRMGRSLVIPTEEASEEARAEFYNKVVERMGGKLAIVPGEDDAAAQAAWRKQQGIPEKAEEYQLPELGEEIPADIISEERANAMKELALKNGIPTKKFQGLMKDMIEMDHGLMQKATEATKAQQETLKDDWGDAYEQRYGRLSAFLERDGAPKELLQAAQSKSLGPDAARYLYGIVERMGGEAAEIARQSGGANIDSVQEAQQKIDEIYANKDHPFFNTADPGHQQALQNMMTLMKRANPGASTEVPSGAQLPHEIAQG